jgi:hypothetical protein
MPGLVLHPQMPEFQQGLRYLCLSPVYDAVVRHDQTPEQGDENCRQA